MVRHFVGKSCPALSSELGLGFETSTAFPSSKHLVSWLRICKPLQVLGPQEKARRTAEESVPAGSVARSCFRYCSLITHHCSLFKFQLSAASGRAGSFRKKLYLISGRIAYAEPDSSTT